MAAGRRARRYAPLAWLHMDPDGDAAAITLTTGPLERVVVRAGFHGHSVTWLGD